MTQIPNGAVGQFRKSRIFHAKSRFWTFFGHFFKKNRHFSSKISLFRLFCRVGSFFSKTGKIRSKSGPSEWLAKRAGKWQKIPKNAKKGVIFGPIFGVTFQKKGSILGHFWVTVFKNAQKVSGSFYLWKKSGVKKSGDFLVFKKNHLQIFKGVNFCDGTY